MKENDVEILTDVEHVLLRPSQYLGSIKPTTKEGFFLKSNSKFDYVEYESVEGLLKIINEIIDNCVDEAIRTGFKFGANIKIDITNNDVTICDDGRGIPIKKVINKETNKKDWAPVVAFTKAKAGANFSDDGRIGLGMNGVGSFITNCFSKVFNMETCHDGKKISLNCRNNLSEYDFKMGKSSKHGTKVYFEPDLARFGLDSIDPKHKQLIKERLTHLGVTFPKIKFVFNGKQVRAKMTKTYLQAFGNTFEYLEDDNYIICIMPNESDDFRHSSHVNGLNFCNGGNHVDHILNMVVNRIKDKYIKRFPNMKPGDIKNKLQIISIFRNFPSIEVDSQTKERLTNSITVSKEDKEDGRVSIKDFLGDINWDKFVTKIIKNKDFIDPIIDTYRIKEEYKKQKEADTANKKLLKKKVKLEKYFPPSRKQRFLFLCEGDSAFGGISPILGREEIGYYAMKGVPLNAYERSNNTILKNTELNGIIQILGLNITQDISDTDCQYDYIVMANDQDADGAHIQGLMIGFFNKIIPDIVKKGKLLRFRTPLIVLKKNNKIVQHFFNYKEFNNFRENNSIKGMKSKYFKGLGTWQPSELKPLIKQFGFNYFLEKIVVNDNSDEYIHNWLSKKTSDIRKEYIVNTKLDILKS